LFLNFSCLIYHKDSFLFFLSLLLSLFSVFGCYLIALLGTNQAIAIFLNEQGDNDLKPLKQGVRFDLQGFIGKEAK
jgi:hypothetical protein